MITHDEWHQKANEKFKELEILEGPGYKVEKTPVGRRVHIRIPQVEESSGGGSSGGGSIPAKVVSKSGIYYLCDLYAGGIDAAATATNQKIFVLQLNLAEDLSAITPKPWIMVSLSAIGQTGGGNVP